MARLVPTVVDHRCPPGEKAVFQLLASANEDWAAVHSLELAPWNRGLRTEIDFLVIIPDVGLLCIEVKSHHNIRFVNDQWYPGSISRSPFSQAADGAYALHRALVRHSPEYKRLPIGYCCIFPFSTFDIKPNLSVNAHECIDSRLFSSLRDGLALSALLKSVLQKCIQADGSLSQLEHPLTPAKVHELVELCIPVRKFRPDLRVEIEHRAKELEELLIDQQKPILQLAEFNTRLVVSGGAGTGKTLIALEIARRAANSGLRTALLCYNRYIGDWLSEQSQPLLPNLVVGSSLRVLTRMADIETPDDAGPDYWEHQVISQLEEKLTDPEFKARAQFDVVVADEAQDLLGRPGLWHCITHFLEGFSENGRFVLFGDFTHQVLADRQLTEDQLARLDNTSRPAHWKLSENCRNYKVVGDTAVQLGGLPELYTRYRRVGGTHKNFDVEYYKDDRMQLSILLQWLEFFKTERYHASEVTILSFKRDELSLGAQAEADGSKVRPYWKRHKRTGYCSIHAYKGLENKVIIVSDLSPVDGAVPEFYRSLLYTSITRATEHVRLLCHESAQQALFRWMNGDLSDD